MGSRGYGFWAAAAPPRAGGGGWEPRRRIPAIRSQPRARGRASGLGLLPGTSTPLEVRRVCRVRRGESAAGLPLPPRAGTQRLLFWLLLLPIEVPNAREAWSASRRGW